MILASIMSHAIVRVVPVRKKCPCPSGGERRPPEITRGPTQTSVRRVFDRVCTVLNDKSVQEIKMPPTLLDQRRTAQQFFMIKNSPRVIGAIDGTQIAIKAPGVDEALYFNREKSHSLNIQLVCDAIRVILSYCSRFLADQEQLIDLSCDGSLKLVFDAGPLEKFWLQVKDEYPSLSTKAIDLRDSAQRSKRNHHTSKGATHDAFVWSNCNLSHWFEGEEFGDFLLAVQTHQVCKNNACLLLHNRCIKRGILLPADVPPLEDEEMDHDDANPAVLQRGRRAPGKSVQQEPVQNYFQQCSKKVSRWVQHRVPPYDVEQVYPYSSFYFAPPVRSLNDI
ncbi:putative nuclease HARBI1 [Scylla paramamosain]|uniref:putative nuclease HARBI1 n=1 Tax=Scylla paramamosain TaxID=85552 RepID=UPI00308322EE